MPSKNLKSMLCYVLQNVVQLSPGTSSDSELSVDIPSADVGGCFVPNIVSLQSTSRPGCVVELTAISDAMQVRG